MTTAQARFATATRDALADPSLHRLLGEVTGRFAELRRGALAQTDDPDALREHARAVKAHTLAHLDEYLLRFEREVVARGGTVHWAATPDDARRIITKIAADSGATRVVKSKSMVSEEIALNEALEHAGATVVETDLGEYIIQLAGERPSHVIAPAIHKSKEDVGHLFADKLGLPYTTDVEVLTRTARERLRQEFASADLGVSGANFLVADTGTVVIVENEGNARLTTSAPRTHVVLAGIEKVVPSIADLAVFLTLLPRSATGQLFTSYASLITGPKREGEIDGPDALHVVLLDNGRTSMLARPELRETLQCIRCGACQNVCPVYRHIGGHAYGSVYGGPIGALVSPHLEAATTSPDLPFASSLCGACAAVCPVKIDLPGVLVRLRNAAMDGTLRTEALASRPVFAWAMSLWRIAACSPSLYRLGAWAMRVALRTAWIRRIVLSLPGPHQGWVAVRELPTPAATSFHEIWESELRGSPR